MKTHGETHDCAGCRFWSEMIAMVERGAVVAMCLADDGPKAGKYTHGRFTCGSWKSGHHGSVDDPPNYGEAVRALYREEEAA